MTEEEYKLALKRVSEIWGAEYETPEGKELDKLINIIVKYEDEHFPLKKAVLPIKNLKKIVGEI